MKKQAFEVLSGEFKLTDSGLRLMGRDETKIFPVFGSIFDDKHGGRTMVVVDQAPSFPSF